MLSYLFIYFLKKFAQGLDRTVLTGSCGPTPVLTVHGINKKSGSLGLKNRFSSQFPVFTVRPPGPVRFWKPWQARELWYHFICFFRSWCNETIGRRGIVEERKSFASVCSTGLVQIHALTSLVAARARATSVPCSRAQPT